MRKIFLDCGAYDGCSVRMFLDRRIDANDFEIFSFEPNPNLAKYHPVYPSQFINKAAWIEDTKSTFFVHGIDGGSTLIKTKSKHNNRKAKRRPTQFSKAKELTVDCIDLCKWIREQFNQDDYIVLKLDIEGAEYPILEKMLTDDTIQYINELYCEFHTERCGMTKKDDEKLREIITQNNVKIYKWDAMLRKYLRETKCAEYKRRR